MDNLLFTILVTLNCWTHGTWLAIAGQNPSAMATVVSVDVPSKAIAQAIPASSENLRLGQIEPDDPLWPWILISVAGGLGVGLGIYCMGRAQLNQPDYFYRIGGKQSLPSQSSNTANADELALPSARRHHSNPQAPDMPRQTNPEITHQTATANSSRSQKLQTVALTRLNRGDTLMQDLQSRDAQRRRRAIWELGQRGTSEAIQPLVDVMLDADSQQRSLILGAIAEIGTRTLNPLNHALVIALQDNDANVRKNAIRDLTRVYTLMAQISQILAHAVMDEDEEVKTTAIWALEQFNQLSSMANLRAADSSDHH